MINKFILILGCLLISFNGYAAEDIVSKAENQSKGLQEKEESVQKETVRLEALKKEVEEGIVKYTALLKQIEKSLKEAEETGNKRLKHVAQAYEAMPPEDAASRLSGLDNETAVQILLKMSSKKAGLVIGMMKSDKATLLTKEIAKMKM